MTGKSSLLLIPVLGVLIALSLSINAIVVNNTDFSINVPDNWAYTNTQDSNGGGSGILLIPTEFSDVFTKRSDADQDFFQNLDAYSMMPRCKFSL